MIRYGLHNLAASLLASFVVVFGVAEAKADISLGVGEFRGVAATKAQWQPLGDYLTSALGETVTIVPIAETKLDVEIGKKPVQFVMVNPLLAAVIKGHHNSVPLASFVQPWGTQFAGVIIANPGSGIHTAADLKGKKLITNTINSAGGYLYQRQYLSELGIKVPDDFTDYKEMPKQDDIVLAVKAGLSDVGFIRTGILEDMVKKNRIQMSDVVVVDEKKGDAAFPFVRTSAMYPEWYVMTVAGTDPALAAKLKTALLAMKSDSETAKALNLKAFVDPLPIEAVVNMLKSFKLPPFDK